MRQSVFNAKLAHAIGLSDASASRPVTERRESGSAVLWAGSTRDGGLGAEDLGHRFRGREIERW